MITDEIYEHLTYDGHQFSSMPVVVPEIADSCLVLNGVAKTYAMTGWRGLDHRSPRHDRRRDQPPVAPDVEREQRCPAPPRRGGERRPRRGHRDAHRSRRGA